jgi:hypothetical protein
LSEYLAPSLTAAVISFIAYVVGVLLMPRTRVCQRTGAWIINKANRYIDRVSTSKLAAGFIPKDVRYTALAWQDIDKNGFTGSHIEQIDDLAMGVLYGAGKKGVNFTPLAHHYDFLTPDKYGQDKGDEDYMLKEINRDLHLEVLSISAPLLAANEKLFNGYDKARSEAEFRFSIHGPVLAITIAIIWANWGAAWWGLTIVGLAGLVTSLALLLKGVTKMNEATDVAIESIKADVVKTKTLERIKALEARPATPDKSSAPASSFWQKMKRRVAPSRTQPPAAG